MNNLKSKIIKANPSILDLTIGSYLNGMGYSNSRVVMLFNNKVFINKGNYCIAEEKLEDVKSKCTCENDIELKHVLIFLIKNKIIYNLEPLLDNTDIVQIEISTGEEEDVFYWNLTKDLDGQSEETKTLLDKLIC